MAWNQASLSLIAPGCRPVVRTVPDSRTITGEPLRILSHKREGTSSQQILRAENLRLWFQEHGFSLHEVPPRYVGWTWEDVEASLEDEEGEVTGLFLRFTLSSESPTRWAIWQALVVELCETWNLNLVDPDRETMVPVADFFELLRRTSAWGQFANHFGWSSPAQTTVESVSH